MRKLLTWVLVAIMALSIVPFASAEEPLNELVISFGLRPNLDIHWNAGTDGAVIMSQMYEGLYQYTETGFELAGATGVKVSEDGLTWTFTLREDAVWTDGKPVTAHDYVNSMRRLVNPEVNSIYMTDYGQFLKNAAAISAGEMPLEELGVTAEDDYTLVIELADVCAYFDALLCYTAFFPIRTDVIDEDGLGYWAWDVEKSITNGPMKMVSCDEEQEIVLDKNETYWNAENIKLDRLTIKLLDDPNTRMSMLTSGDIDMIFGVPSEESQRMMDLGYYHNAPNLVSYFFLVNCQEEPLSNPLVRRAISLVIDREYMAEVLYMGTKIPAEAIVGNGFPGSAPGVDFREEGGPLLKYDPDEARALLAEAGYPNGEGFPVVEVLYSNTSADYAANCEYLQAVMEDELGIKVQLSPIENTAMAELRDGGQFGITPQGWGVDYFDASNMLAIFVTGNFINGGRFSSQIFDDFYNNSIHEPDNAKRMEMLHAAEENLLVEEMGIIPLYHSAYVFLYDENVVSNVRVNANAKVILTDCIVTR